MTETLLPIPELQPANSVGDLVERISDLVEKTNKIPWFRGHRSSDWKVAPTLWREPEKYDERDLTNRFCSRAATRYAPLPSYDQDARWLSLMQHYGLPTRLLDWTRSPLMAAYFALEHYIYDRDVESQEASIWVLLPHTLNAAEGFGALTPSIEARMCEALLKPAFTEKAQEGNKVLAVMSVENDIRMFVQQGCFTIHSDRTPLEDRPGRGNYLWRLRIPPTAVRSMATQIHVCGFRKGDIYPDLGHLADELKVLRAR